jgi:hypothetical protein
MVGSSRLWNAVAVTASLLTVGRCTVELRRCYAATFSLMAQHRSMTTSNDGTMLCVSTEFWLQSCSGA